MSDAEMQKARRRKRAHECDRCECRFGTLTALQEHKNTHSGEKPFSCDTCKKAFGHRSALWNHRRIHLDLYPFKCDVCSKKFKWKNSLASHSVTHTRYEQSVSHIDKSNVTSYTGRLRPRNQSQCNRQNRALDLTKKGRKLAIGKKRKRAKKLSKRKLEETENEPGVLENPHSDDGFESLSEQPLDLSLNALNLCPRDLLQFESDEDQQQYERLFSEAESDENPGEIRSPEIDALFSPDEGEYEIVAWGIQCVTSAASISHEQSIGVVENAVCVQLAPMQPLNATSPGEREEIDQSTASNDEVLSDITGVPAEEVPYEMW